MVWWIYIYIFLIQQNLLTPEQIGRIIKSYTKFKENTERIVSVKGSGIHTNPEVLFRILTSQSLDYDSLAGTYLCPFLYMGVIL